mgnify:FL=1
MLERFRFFDDPENIKKCKRLVHSLVGMFTLDTLVFPQRFDMEEDTFFVLNITYYYNQNHIVYNSKVILEEKTYDIQIEKQLYL